MSFKTNSSLKFGMGSQCFVLLKTPRYAITAVEEGGMGECQICLFCGVRHTGEFYSAERALQRRVFIL